MFEQESRIVNRGVKSHQSKLDATAPSFDHHQNVSISLVANLFGDGIQLTAFVSLANILADEFKKRWIRMNRKYIVKLALEPELLPKVMQSAIPALSDKGLFQSGVLISYRMSERALVCEAVEAVHVDEVKSLLTEVAQSTAPAPVHCITVHDSSM